MGKKISSDFQQKFTEGQAQKGKGILQDLHLQNFLPVSSATFHVYKGRLEKYILGAHVRSAVNCCLRRRTKTKKKNAAMRHVFSKHC